MHPLRRSGIFMVLLLTFAVQASANECTNRLVFGPGVIHLSESIVVYKGSSKVGGLRVGDKNFERALNWTSEHFLSALNKQASDDSETPAEYRVCLSSLRFRSLSNALVSIPLCASTLGANYKKDIAEFISLFQQEPSVSKGAPPEEPLLDVPHCTSLADKELGEIQAEPRPTECLVDPNYDHEGGQDRDRANGSHRLN